MRRFRHEYGSTLLHLGLGLLSFAIAAFAVWQLTELPAFWRVVVWLAGAIVLHDLVLLPIYSALGLAGIRASRWSARVWPGMDGEGATDLLNHLRIPAIVSGLLLLMFFPLILGVASESFKLTTGLGTSVYLTRWLWITFALFAGSLIIYLVRRMFGRRGPEQ